jgi:hypothetical protein
MGDNEAANNTGGADTTPLAVTPTETPKKGNPVNKLIGIAVAVVVVLILIMVLISTHKTKVNMSKYVTITYSGYNTVGKATADIDYDKLYNDYGSKIDSEDELEYYTGQLLFYAVASGSLDKTNGLSNGDKVTFTWDTDGDMAEVIEEFESKYKFNLVYKDVTGTVEGLEDADIYDPFESVTLNFSGYNGYGNASLDQGSAKVKNLSYSVSPNSNLSNGDTVTITVKAPGSQSLEDYCMTYGYVPGQNEKTVTVSGLDEIKDYDPFAGLSVSFEGVSSLGEVQIDNSGVEMKDVRYTADQTDGLANGDTITITASYSGWYFDSIEDYLVDNGYKPTATTKTYEVSGLTDAQDFDPFEKLEVTFSGTSPYGEVSINSDKVEVSGLDYSISKSRNLSNDEEITITVTGSWGADLENYCLERGYVPTQSEKTYTVEGLAFYVTELDQIPDSVMNEMDEQIQDSVKASVASKWRNPDTFTGIKLLGCYLLYPKSMDNRDSANYLYLVYQIDVKPEDGSKFSYYYYAYYQDLVCVDDNEIQYDVMSYRQTSDTFRKDNLSYTGYEKLSNLYNNCVTARIDRYKCDTNIED